MQKTYSFRLLAFTCIIVFCSACHFNANMQTRGQVFLQGEWQQDSIPKQKQLVSYSLYHLRFSCDSFFMSISSFSKVNTGPDSCMDSGHWTEYTRGTYVQKNDTLHLKGQFCNADLSLKDDKGCFRSGDYEEFFKLNQSTDTTLQFASTTSVIPINAHLIKKTSCIPKPL